MGHNSNVYADSVVTDQEDLEALGQIAHLNVIHKFGYSANVGSTYVPLAQGNVYQVPTTAQTLEIVSDDAGDNNAGAGAREVTIEGLDSAWNLATTTVIPNGVTPVTIDTDFIRVFRAYVTSTGTYATATAGSHVGTLTIQDEATSLVTWAVIDATDFPFGQTTIGAYTVPAGKKAIVKYWEVIVDAAVAVDITFFQRPAANDVTVPYSGVMRLVDQASGIDAQVEKYPHSPFGPFDEYTDIGFLGKVAAGTGAASVNFELQLYDK